MPQFYQTLYVLWLNHILFITATITNFSWWMLPWAFINMHIWACMSEMSIHRYFTHKTYEVSARFKEHILKAFAFLVGQGPVLGWVTVHRQHHRKEDTPEDPHSPHHRPWWKIYLGFLPREYPKNLVVDYLRHPDSRYFIFENQYYWLMWTATWIISYLISPYLFYMIVSGSAMWYFATNMINIYAHNGKLGQKPHTDSSAYNSGILETITSVGKHNNHHLQPGSYTYVVDPDTEFDWIAEVIKRFGDSFKNVKQH